MQEAIVMQSYACLLDPPAVQISLIQVCIDTLGQSNGSFLRTSGHICDLGHYCR